MHLNRSRNILLTAISLLWLAATPSFADTKPAAVTPAAPSISVLIAQKKPIASSLTVTGSFAAGELVLVSPEIEGLAIEEFMAEEGDVVKKGDVLVRLSGKSTEIKITQNAASLAANDAAIAQAQNQIEQAKIGEERASADLNRTKKLRTSGVSTVEQFDQRQAAYDLAASQLSAAKLGLETAKANRLSITAQLEDLNLQMSRTEIKAPVDGFISKRTVQVGSIASANRDPLYNIVANGTIKLLAEVAESDLPKVKIGQKATIVVNGIDKPIEGTVKLVSPEVNSTTRIGIAHIRIADGVRVPLGSFGRAQISLAASEGVTLPLTAVTFGENGPTVQVVVHNKVEVHKVITGLVSTDEIEVTDGVNVGDTVVAKAGTFVRDGDMVTPIPVASN